MLLHIRLHSPRCWKEDSGAPAQKLLDHHLVPIREEAPAQHSPRDIPSATTESNHQREELALYMSVEITMAAESTATAPEVIASFLRLSDRSFLCIQHCTCH